MYALISFAWLLYVCLCVCDCVYVCPSFLFAGCIFYLRSVCDGGINFVQMASVFQFKEKKKKQKKKKTFGLSSVCCVYFADTDGRRRRPEAEKFVDLMKCFE